MSFQHQDSIDLPLRLLILRLTLSTDRLTIMQAAVQVINKLEKVEQKRRMRKVDKTKLGQIVKSHC